MTNQTSIKYISSLLDRPETISEGDQSSIALFRQTFPYFVPTRYLVALESHKKTPYTPQMLSAMQPYLGDWILFCDFLDAGRRAPTEQLASTPKVVDKKMVDIQPASASPIPQPVPIPKEDEKPVAVVIPEEVVSVAPAAVMPEEEISPFSFAPVVAVVEEKPEIPFINRIKEDLPVIQPEPEAPVEAQAPPVVPEPVIAMAEEDIPVIQPEPIFNPPAPVAEVIKEEPPLIVVPEAVFEPPVAETPVYIAPHPVEIIESEVPAVPSVEPVAPHEDITTEVVGEPASAEPVPHAFIPITEQPYVPGYTEQIIEQASAADVPPVSETGAEVFKDPVEESAFAKAWAEKESEDTGTNEEEETEGNALEIVNETGEGYAEEVPDKDNDPLIFPIYTKDYFLQQGEKISDEIPLEINELKDTGGLNEEEDKSLMVVMSFSEWLLHFKNSSERQKEETKDQKALKTMWQKEKLAAAMEEENEEIPETVFEMAVNSISKEEGLVSETLAEIHIKQGKYDKAIEMYRKLSLRNPQKSVYFARKIEEALKDKQS